MQSKIGLIQEEEVIKTFKLLATAYEEISVVKMQRVRSSVLSTRKFLEMLSEIFFDVKVNYKREITQLLAQNKKGVGTSSLSTLNKNGKTVSVLLSSNTKLYGDIIKRVYTLFIDTATKTDTDIVIIGRVGREYFEQGKHSQKYIYFDMPDNNVTFADIEPIIKILLLYERVNVYYGRFANVITQVPTVTNVSGEEAMNIEVETEKKIKFMFEPNLIEILNFFEGQVFESLFKQTADEAELARLASRIRAMETALGTIEETEGSLRNFIRKNTRLLKGKKQIEALSGISLWGKRT